MSEKREKGRPPHPDILTPAEWRVVEGVRHGLTNPQIAKLQGVSLNAVKFHMSNILAKLELESRSNLRLWSGINASSLRQPVDSNPAENNFENIGQISRKVSDLEASAKWFKRVLGLERIYTFENIAFLKCGPTRIFLNLGNPEHNSILYFVVPDIQQAYLDVQSRGAEAISAPHMIHRHTDSSEEWMAFFKDFDHQPLGLISLVIPPSINKEML